MMYLRGFLIFRRVDFRQIFLYVLIFSLSAFTLFAQVPASNHVVFVLLENHNYSSIVGSPSMPNLNNLISTYGLATQYYANTHPSIGNYFMLTTGQIITNDDSYAQAVTVDNLVREILAGGKTWKSYAQSLPYDGFLDLACCPYYPYLAYHNSFAYFSDVRNNSTQALNVVQFETHFSSDVFNNQLPNYAFVLPDAQHDGHDCPPGMPKTGCTDEQKMSYVDNWLQTYVFNPLLQSTPFQSGGDGILVVTFDEADDTDNTNGGGRIMFTVIGPKVKPGYQSTTLYQHHSGLKLACAALGIGCPGAGFTAPGMGEFFTSPGSSTPTCTLTISPTSGPVPLSVSAIGSCTDPDQNIVSTVLDWGDGTTQTATSGSHSYSATGTYTVRLIATDATNLIGSASQTVTVNATGDFSLSVSPTSRQVSRGTGTTYNVSVSAQNGFAGAVGLGVSGLPSGATVSFTPASITKSGKSSLTVSTASTTPTGTYTLTVTGTSGSLAHSAKVSLRVK